MMPEVGYRVPEAPELYNIYEKDGIEVYVMKNVNTFNNKLEFVANTFMFVTTLDVKGVKVNL